MARIRSIKPDFFTSETIARLSVSARLTFIGLWTHVDDNGVCRANELLIAAALYPLDGLEGVRRTREDLRRLSGESLVTLYEYDGKRYLWVSSWDEHQKVSHPGKPRYPRPDSSDCKLVNWDNDQPPEPDPPSSGESPEILRPEQGAGSRVEGSREQGVPPSAGAEAPQSRAALAVVPDELPAVADPPTAQSLIGEWLDHCQKRPPGNVIGQVGKHLSALIAEGIDPEDVRAGLVAWHSKALHPSTLPSVVNEVMNADSRQPIGGPPRATANQDMLQRAMERAQAKEASGL